MKNVKKEKLVSKSKPKVTMLEYSIEMTIPTGSYANIKPCIVVKAATPEEALDYIAPHMNRMWKEYFMVNERRVEVSGIEKKVESTPVVNTTYVTPPVQNITIQQPVAENSPTSNVSVIKATQAINSCTSLEALDLIKNQIELSVKLDKADKPALRQLIIDKINEINADEFVKKHGG